MKMVSFGLMASGYRAVTPVVDDGTAFAGSLASVMVFEGADAEGLAQALESLAGLVRASEDFATLYRLACDEHSLIDATGVAEAVFDMTGGRDENPPAKRREITEEISLTADSYDAQAVVQAMQNNRRRGLCEIADFQTPGRAFICEEQVARRMQHGAHACQHHYDLLEGQHSGGVKVKERHPLTGGAVMAAGTSRPAKKGGH